MASFEEQQLEWMRRQGLLNQSRDVMDPRSPIQGSLDPAQMAGNIQDYFAPGGRDQGWDPDPDVGDYRQSAKTRARLATRQRMRENGINPDTGELIQNQGDDGGGFFDNMFSNMFSGSKSAGRAMAAGGAMGSGIGGLVGGLVNMFQGQPSAMLDAYRRLQTAMQNIDNPEIQRQVWSSPVFRQIAQYRPELLRDLTERPEDMETYEEGDAGLRAQEDVALSRISERARRGDPLSQRIATQAAQSQVGRELGRAAQAGSEMAARRGLPGAGTQGLQQAQADYASRVGMQNVLASRGAQQQAEMAALSGASSIRQQRESATERAMNIRNNFRNAMSNRQLSINISNQQARQQADDRNQTMAQRLHESNLSRADQRRIANQDRQNQWEQNEYDRDVARVQREGQVDIMIGQAEDEADRARAANMTGLLQGAGNVLGTGVGAGFLPV